MIGNFIRLTDEFGDDMYAGDVESFFVEYVTIVQCCFELYTDV